MVLLLVIVKITNLYHLVNSRYAAVDQMDLMHGVQSKVPQPQQIQNVLIKLLVVPPLHQRIIINMVCIIDDV